MLGQHVALIHFLGENGGHQAGGEPHLFAQFGGGERAMLFQERQSHFHLGISLLRAHQLTSR